MVGIVQIVMFWILTLHSLVGGHSCVRGTCQCHAENGGSIDPSSSGMLISTYRTTQCQNREHHNVSSQIGSSNLGQ
jgi:hypothetical protein